MQSYGKILFYNANEGTGIIITSAKKKYNFEIADWDDFEQMPAAGLSVGFVLSGERAVNLCAAAETGAAKADESSLRTAADEGVDQLKGATAETYRLPPVIRLSVNADKAINDYFIQIKEHILEHSGYRKIKGRIDFLRIRRFLITIFNNLFELDPHFVTPEIRKMYGDMMQMSRVYDDYRAKATFPDVAYEKIFLSRQDEYMGVRHDMEQSRGELQRLRGSEIKLSDKIKEKQEVIDKTPRPSVRYGRIEEDFKEVKGLYVDTVHNIATLENHLKEAMGLLGDFEKCYHDEFFEAFNQVSNEYRKLILQILDAQAYNFDEMVWEQAKRSSVIKNFFKEAHIDGEYCSKTYLKYYLNTLDRDLISSEQHELFQLFEYLESLEKDVVVAVVSDVDMAMDMKGMFVDLRDDVLCDVFLDETKALRWAMDNRANMIVIEDTLQHMQAAAFIREFQKRVIRHPKVIVISDEALIQFKSLGAVDVVKKSFNDFELETVIRRVIKQGI